MSDQPSQFFLAKGRLYSYWCPDCRQSNGGGVEIEEYSAEADPHSPLNQPCLWCNRGPMVKIYEGFSNGEAI